MDNNTIPVYELSIKDEDSVSGVYAASLVSDPAIQESFVALSEMKPLKLEADSKKMILTGPFIVPDRYIYRVDPKGNEYYVVFKRETIEKIVKKFFKSGFQSNTSHQHFVPLAGNTIIESWIVEDPKMDKAKKLGFDVPIGTWMISVKIEDKEYWNNEIETGNVKGFSLEGFFTETFKTEYEGEIQTTVQMSKKQIKFSSMPDKKKKTPKKMTIKSLLNALGWKFSEETPAKETPVNLASFWTEDGTEVIVDDTTLSVKIYDEAGNEVGVLKVEMTPEEVTSPEDTMEPVENPEEVTASETPIEEKASESSELMSVVSELTKQVETLKTELSVIKAGTVKPVKMTKDEERLPGKKVASESFNVEGFISKRKNK